MPSAGNITAGIEWIVSLQLQQGDRQRLASLFDRVESMSEEKALETLSDVQRALWKELGEESAGQKAQGGEDGGSSLPP